MNQPQKVLKSACLILLAFILSTCQKEESPIDNQIYDSESDMSLLHLKATNSVSNYLLGLIDVINGMISDGSINKGIGNSLIMKIENAIKSVEKSHTSVVTLSGMKANVDKNNNSYFKGQMQALINQLEAFLKNGMIAAAQGQELISKAENAVILSDGGFVDSRDGYKYAVVLIGDQLWMAENLRATKFNDGTEIPLIENIIQWSTTNTPGYCWYANDFETYGSVYGALYNWYAVKTGKLNPVGWHVPSDAEWTILIDFLGGEEVAGGKLKEAGTTHWLSPNDGATNESGFTALPGDARYYMREYYFIGSHAHWWTSSEDYADSDKAWLRWLVYDSYYALRMSANKHYGLSLRCIKD